MATLLVTGASGFLGQHIVKLVHEKRELNISKLVVFDIRPFKKQLEYTETVAQECVTGDITKPADVREAVRGVDCVIHACGYVSIQTFPDTEGMNKINVEGTKNILDACIEEGVRTFVATSSDSVVVSYNDHHDADERVPYPREDDLIMKPYSITKQRAEKLVLRAHGTALKNGGRLNTLAVRAMGMYGEGDVAIITPVFRRAGGRKTVFALGYWRQPGANVQELLYVGNSAWGHLCAVKALRENPDQCGGEAYFLTDDTPRGTLKEICTPFVHEFGLSYANFRLPCTALLYALYFIEFFLTLISPVYKYSLPLTTNTMYMVNVNATFNRQKLETKCNYSRCIHSTKVSNSLVNITKIL